MTAPTHDTQSKAVGDTLDLAALGRTWTPPDIPDTSPEVADVLSSLPPIAMRGLIYLVFLSVTAACACVIFVASAASSCCAAT